MSLADKRENINLFVSLCPIERLDLYAWEMQNDLSLNN